MLSWEKLKIRFLILLKNNLTLETLSNMTNISISTLSNIENDKIENISGVFLYRLSKVFNIDYDYLLENANTSYESMQNYVKQYLNEHPPLFVIGSEKPGVKCLWFNTGDGSETTENTITEILDDSAGNTIYAEVAE